MNTARTLSQAILSGCLLTTAACSSEESSEEEAEGAEAVTLTTRDDVTIAGDHYSASSGTPGLLLLHMNPAAGNDRSNWPVTFIEQLHANDWHLLVIDRRGSGQSGGEAQDAFEGENGRYDVEAAAQFLQNKGAGDLVIVAASNGTTSLLDYALWAPGEGLPEPTVATLLTGGSYTENQNSFSEFPAIPTLFSYSSDEADWSNTQQAADPGPWVFQEYADGAHGTHLFEAAPTLGDDIEAFLVDSL